MTIVYDNNRDVKGFTPAWGFACVIQGMDKNLLFDTGGDGSVLLGNMSKAEIDPAGIDAVVLSHVHGDHTGGIIPFLRAAGPRPVYVPEGFPRSLLKQIGQHAAEVVECGDSVEICPGARTTGTLGKGAIEEQGLCVQTAEGWVLVTGCSHPGVDNLAAKTHELTGGPIRLVVGGFHMGGYSSAQTDQVIDRLSELDVQSVAPCHCTGEAARARFKERFKDQCVLGGVGHRFFFDPVQ